MVVHRSVRTCTECLLPAICTHFKAMLVCLLNHVSESSFNYIYVGSFFLVISSVSPNTGSTQGSTTLTINGENFCSNAQYPVVVNVGGQPCTVVNVSLTSILCQTPAAPMSIASQYHGK
jgi:hypothetical protein